MKDMKMKTKTILGFATPIVLTVFNVILGDMAAKGVLTRKNRYSKRYPSTTCINIT